MFRSKEKVDCDDESKRLWNVSIQGTASSELAMNGKKLKWHINAVMRTLERYFKSG